MKQLKSFLALILLALAVSATSCHTVKKACATLDKHPKEAAQYCGTKFPPKTFTKTLPPRAIKGKPDTVKGETVYVTVDCDTAKTKIVKAPCPPTKTIYRTDTLIQRDTTVVENTAISEALHYELTDSKVVANSATANAVKWRGRTLWTWGILALVVIITGVYRYLKAQYSK